MLTSRSAPDLEAVSVSVPRPYVRLSFLLKNAELQISYHIFESFDFELGILFPNLITVQ